MARTVSRAFLQVLRPLASILLPHYLLLSNGPPGTAGLPISKSSDAFDELAAEADRQPADSPFSSSFYRSSPPEQRDRWRNLLAFPAPTRIIKPGNGARAISATAPASAGIEIVG